MNVGTQKKSEILFYAINPTKLLIDKDPTNFITGKSCIKG